MGGAGTTGKIWKNMEKLYRLFHPCHVPGGSPTNSNKSMKHGTAKPPQLTTSQQTKTDAIKFHVYTTCFWISLCSHKWIYSPQSPDFGASSPKWNRKLSPDRSDQTRTGQQLRPKHRRPGSNNNSFWQDLPNIHKLNDTSQKRVGNGRQRPPKNMIYQQYKRYRRRSPYWVSRATTFHWYNLLIINVNICLRVPIFKKNAYDPAKTTIALYNDDDIRRSFPFEMVPFSAKHSFIWVFPKIRVPQNGCFIMKNPYKNGWFGGPTPIFGNTHFRVALKKTKHRKGTWIQPSKLCISPLCVIWSKMPGDVFLLSRGDEETLPSKATCDRSSDHQKRDVWYTKAPKKKTEMRL